MPISGLNSHVIDEQFGSGLEASFNVHSESVGNIDPELASNQNGLAFLALWKMQQHGVVTFVH